MIIPEGYVIEKFFMYCKRPVVRRSSNTYNAECPYCREGKSAGRKRRFFYIPSEGYLYCQNECGTKSPLQFIKDMTGMSTGEVLREAEEYITPVDTLIKQSEEREKRARDKVLAESLPKDSINLFDDVQTSYFKSNKVVQDALALIKRRRLDTAVNRPHALWISLTDEVHKNRLCFPFYDFGSKYKISFYQTRAIYPEDEAGGRKYITKIGGDKAIYNIQNVTYEIDYIFLLEGPIDSMFVRNGVGIAGAHLTDQQKELLAKHFPMHKLVYVFDNQYLDDTSRKRTAKIIEEGHMVFIWPPQFRKYKDLNELCVANNLNEIPAQYLLRYVYSGLKATMALSEVLRQCRD